MGDGQLAKIYELTDIKPGCVVRPLPVDDLPPFSDCVIMKIEPETELVTLARPYLYVSCADTLCASTLSGCEEFTVGFEALKRRFVQVKTARGNMYEYVT